MSSLNASTSATMEEFVRCLRCRLPHLYVTYYVTYRVAVLPGQTATRQAFLEVDMWCRRKVRCIYRKYWKKVEAKFKALVRLGVPRRKARGWANSRRRVVEFDERIYRDPSPFHAEHAASFPSCFGPRFSPQSLPCCTGCRPRLSSARPRTCRSSLFPRRRLCPP